MCSAGDKAMACMVWQLVIKGEKEGYILAHQEEINLCLSTKTL